MQGKQIYFSYDWHNACEMHSRYCYRLATIGTARKPGRLVFNFWARGWYSGMKVWSGEQSPLFISPDTELDLRLTP